MGKFKGNLFWIFIAVILLAELCVYLLPIPGTVRTATGKNKESVDSLRKAVKQLDAFMQPGNASNQGMIDVALEKKSALDREYLRMCLLLMGKDNQWDRYFDLGPNKRIPSWRMLQLQSQERTLLLNEIILAKNAVNKKATDADITLDPAQTCWDWVKLEGGTASPKLLIYAHKQIFVQQRLVDLMSEPVKPVEATAAGLTATPAAAKAAPEPKPAAVPPNAKGAADKGGIGGEKNQPLVLLLNKILFKVPYIDESSEAVNVESRYVYYTLNLDVSLLPEHTPILLERIINCGLPLTITSFSIERGMEKIAPQIAAKILGGKSNRTLVNVKIECKLLDFSVGLQKVEFAKDRFASPKEVDKFFSEQTDPVMRALKSEIDRGTVSTSKDNTAAGVEYLICGERIVGKTKGADNSEVKAEVLACELEKGITVHYGVMDPNVPK